MSDNNENKVVQFPLHKVKKSQTETASTLDQPMSPQKRMNMIISLVATVFVATLVMNQLNQTKSLSGQERGLASMDSVQNVSQRNLIEDIMLARKIARESLREPASRGREPSKEDILRHGVLKGLYSIHFNDAGALVAIEYNADREPAASQENNGASAVYVNNREQFLRDISDLLRVDFDQAAKIETVNEDKSIHELYELRASSEPRGRVHFKVDAQDHLYSMKVESIK